MNNLKSLLQDLPFGFMGVSLALCIGTFFLGLTAVGVWVIYRLGKAVITGC